MNFVSSEKVKRPSIVYIEIKKFAYMNLGPKEWIKKLIEACRFSAILKNVILCSLIAVSDITIDDATSDNVCNLCNSHVLQSKLSLLHTKIL